MQYFLNLFPLVRIIFVYIDSELIKMKGILFSLLKKKKKENDGLLMEIHYFEIIFEHVFRKKIIYDNSIKY